MTQTQTDSMSPDIKKIHDNLLILIQEYAKYDDNEAFTAKGLEVSQSIYFHTDALMDLGEEGVSVIQGIMKTCLDNGNIDEFDVIHGTMIELMTSGFNINDIPYTLMWLGVTSFRDKEHFNLDGFDTILKNAMFESGITTAIDQTHLIETVLPINFKDNLGIDNVYTFVSQFLDEQDKCEFNKKFSEQEILSCTNKDIPTFYLPFFVQGEYSEVVEKIYENTDLIEDKIQQIANSVLGNEDVVFHTPVHWADATEENASKIVNTGKLAAFFDLVASTNNPHIEIAVLAISDVKDSYVIFSLDKSDGSIRGVLKIDKEDDYMNLMGELIPMIHEYKFPLVQPNLKIHNFVVDELLSQHENQEHDITEKSKSILLNIFSDYETIDRNQAFQMFTGSTLTIH